MPPARSSGRGSKRRRISRSAEFERVYRQGRSHANRWFVVYAFPRAASEEAPRLGLSVSRRVGGAVERNRVKRLVREAFWAETDRLAPDADYVVVARPESRVLGDEKGVSGVREALSELLDRHREPGRRRRRGATGSQSDEPDASEGEDRPDGPPSSDVEAGSADDVPALGDVDERADAPTLVAPDTPAEALDLAQEQEDR